MKNFIYTFILLHFSVVTFGQSSDTTCLKSRWLSVKPTIHNKDIFLLDSIDNSLDLVYTIKKLVDQKQLRIYDQNEGPNGMNNWYYINYEKEIEMNLKQSLKKEGKDPYFEIVSEAIIPLANSVGEDSVIKNDDGSMSYVFPESKVYVFPSKECDEIRIKEDRVFNKATKKYEFIPVGLSFYFKGDEFSKGKEKFWVDLNELFNVLNDKNKYPWYNAIVNKKYVGFQYRQVSCYDIEIKK